MKKVLGLMLSIVLFFLFIGFSFSDSVLDYLDDIGGDILFGYAAIDEISVDSISDTSIVISSPVLKDEFDDVISNYTLMYGEYPLTEVLDDPSLLDYSKEKVFENLNLVGESVFTLDLLDSDGLDQDKIYYVVVVPKDDAGTIGEISNELCFRLADQIYGEGTYCEDTGVVGPHGAGADMTLASVSHVLNGSMLTLNWIALNGSDTIDLFLRNEADNSFDKLDTVNMTDESYSFDLNRDGDFIVKFIPSNGGVEKDYTFNVSGIGDIDIPTSPDVVVPVVVGPKENIIAILIATVLIYVVYRVIKRKV